SWGMSGSNNNGLSGSRSNGYDFELQIGDRHSNVTILVVGTKADLVKQELTGRQRRYSIVDEYGGDSAEKINAFFDKVIDKRFGFMENLPSPTFGNFATSSSISSITGVLSNRDDRRRSTVGTTTNGLPSSPVLTGFSRNEESNGLLRSPSLSPVSLRTLNSSPNLRDNNVSSNLLSKSSSLSSLRDNYNGIIGNSNASTLRNSNSNSNIRH
ncbi:25371_t:CDS:2, partial [Dentiscutata erythropus]